jgi:hypothetical protein
MDASTLFRPRLTDGHDVYGVDLSSVPLPHPKEEVPPTCSDLLRALYACYWPKADAPVGNCRGRFRG